MFLNSTYFSYVLYAINKETYLEVKYGSAYFSSV